MKGLFGSLLFYLWMAGCSVGLPPWSDIDRIEAITRRDACVVDLSRWHRRYEYALSANRIDRDRIRIVYSEPGRFGLPAGRSRSEPETTIYEGQFRVAGGTFDRPSGRLVKWGCGCNLGMESSDRPTECPRYRT